MHDIFLSYSHKDTETMQRVKQSFIAAGLKVWTDEGIEIGSLSWKWEIENAILSTSCLVCLLSPDAHDSQYVRAELDFAELQEKQRFLILVRGEPKSVVPFGYATYQWNDIRSDENYDLEIQRLIATIQGKEPAPHGTSTTKSEASLSNVSALLPAPFDWLAIPEGEVILKDGWDKNIHSINQRFDVPAFYMAKYPITNAQFAQFIEAGGYQNKKWWTSVGWDVREQGYTWKWFSNTWKATGKAWIEPVHWQDKKWNGAKQPVIGLSWYEAVAYCLWLSDVTGLKIMLPTEQEWQRAAGGDDRREYPWGNEFDKAKANTEASKLNKTTVIDAYPAGVSPYEVWDMAGNVWEWTLTAYESGRQDVKLSNNESRVLRGGSWSHAASDTRVAYRYLAHPAARNKFYGFRLACHL